MASFRAIIKAWYLTSLKPTQTQFHSWLDMSWLKDEQIPVANISGIDNLLLSKADKEYVDNLFEAMFPTIEIGGYKFNFKSRTGNSSPVSPLLGDIAYSGFITDDNNNIIEFGQVLIYIDEPSDIEKWQIRNSEKI